MSNHEFPARLVADLEKSGFGSELSALQVFHRAKFETVAGKVYFDKLLNCQREVDLSAVKDIVSGSDVILQAIISIVGEVKKSEDPWVVLKSTATYENPYNVYLSDTLIEISNARAPTHSIGEKLARSFLASRDPWFGYGIYEAFKKPNALRRWFKAASSVCRASWNAMTTRAG